MNTHFLHDRRKVSLCETKSSVTKELFAKLFLFFFYTYYIRWYCNSILAGVRHHYSWDNEQI
jgi:hypothetical protein